MAQNLIITNDKDSEFVQFTITLPEGYKSFSIDSINGTMINQNFLKVGDKLSFKFSNNPYVYYSDASPNKYALDAYMIPGDNWTARSDDWIEHFKGFQVDIFQFYRIKFLPVFFYYRRDASPHFIYIFTPCDPKLIYDEIPDNIDNPIVEGLGGGSTATPWYATFTGHYIIGLESVDKINDIDITIGETINNSKTRLQEMGTYQETDTIQRFIDTNYTYATSWRYNVSNLLIQHKPYTITTNASEFKKYVLNVVRSLYNGSTIAITNSKEFNHQPIMKATEYKINNYNYDFYYWNTSTSAWDALNVFMYYDVAYSENPEEADPSSPRQMPYVIFMESGGYYSKEPDPLLSSELPDCVDNNGIMSSFDVSSNCRIITDSTDIDNIQDAAIGNVIHIKGDIYYSFHWTTCALQLEDPDHNPEHDYYIANAQAGDYLILGDDHITGINTNERFTASYYYTKTQTQHNNINFIICEVVDGEELWGGSRAFYLADNLTLNNDAYFTYADSIYTGYDYTKTSPSYEVVENSNSKKLPVQLTQNNASNDNVKPAFDDILINKVNDDMFKISMPKLNNNYYKVVSNNEYGNTTIYEVKWSESVVPRVFVPHRSNESI